MCNISKFLEMFEVSFQTCSDHDHVYNVSTIIEIIIERGKPPLFVPVSTLSPQLDRTCWGEMNGPRFSPNDVLRCPDNPFFSPHYQRILYADLSYPVIILDSGKGECGWIVDGMHRLAKAYLEERGEIAAFVLKSLPIEAIVEDLIE